MDDFRTALMQMLSGRTSGDASSQLQEILLARVNQRPQGDPLRNVLTQMLAQRRPASPKPQADPHALLRAARDALKVMQARSAIVAAALGACSECLGEEADCPTCHGAGRSGWTAPDPVAFETWVRPAIWAADQAARGAAVRRAGKPTPKAKR